MNDEAPAPPRSSNEAASTVPTTDIASLVAEHYSELRALAERQLRVDGMPGGRQPSPTSLLGETFAHLLRQRNRIVNREHLSAIATMIFVRILADRRRRELALKRGGGSKPMPIDGAAAPRDDRTAADEAIFSADIDRLHEKLSELAEREPRRAEALSLNAIGGLSAATVADLLGVSEATVQRDIALARAWLATQMKD